MNLRESMRPAEGDRRGRQRTPRFLRHQVKLSYFSESGVSEVVTAKVLDITEGGYGLELPGPLTVGTLVSLSGDSLKGPSATSDSGETCVRARIIWCTYKGASWRAGCARDNTGQTRTEREASNASSSQASGSRKAEAGYQTQPISVETDYYELLQLSPNADPDTVHRVYRLMAQRFHPDNNETGDQEMFKRILDAYRVLGDAEKRAAYDVDYNTTRRLRWKIFDQPKTAQGFEAEKRKRKGVLSLLYAKRANQPDSPAISLMELEDLLGIPREHLEFTLWYLKENGMATRGDNMRYSITVKGCDAVEQDGEPQPVLRDDRLLPEPARPGTAAA